MRRYLIMMAVLAFGASPVLAVDRVAMPYACSARAGKLSVDPSPMQTYEIAGRREQRVYTACREKGSPHCKTMMVHRFLISCGGAEIPWFKVAAKIRSNTIGASWLEHEQLNLLVRTDKGNTQHTARFIMPKEFAPIAELGAVLNPAGELTSTSEQIEAAIPPAGPQFHDDAVIADEVDAAVAAAAAVAAEQSVPDSGESAALLLTDTDFSAGGSWQTVVYKYDAAAPVRPATAGLEFIYPLVALLLTAALATLGFFGGRWRPDFGFPRVFTAMRAGPGRWWREATDARQLRPDNEAFYNGVDSIAALLLQVESIVHSLKSVGPLRETLSGELKGIRQRLASLKRAEQNELSEARTSANLRAIVRDLERIRRIADSAAISMPGGRQSGGAQVPKTAAEAYELLGINSSVSEATLKKIVDGLRMSWHPDLARDEDDRGLREERTKSINIAWDLITGKRAA